MDSPDRAPGREPDLRLAPFALACWAGALTVLYTSLRTALVLAAIALAAAVLLLAADRAARRHAETRHCTETCHCAETRCCAVARRRMVNGAVSGKLREFASRFRQFPRNCASLGGESGPSEGAGGSGRRRGSGARWRWIVAGACLGVACGAVATGARLSARDAPELVELVRRHASEQVLLTVRDDPRAVAGVTGRDATWVVAANLDAVAGLRTDVRVLVLAADGGWRGLLPGQQVRARVRFGPSRGGDLRAAVLSADAAPQPLGPAPWAQRAAGVLRSGLQRACAPLDRATGGLLPGLVVGDVSQLDQELSQQFRQVGLTHLNAVSGSNVAVVLGAVLLLARWCRAGPRLSAVLCAVALVGFVILVRPSPSVLRAAAMGSVALLALASGRSRAALPALAATVAALLVIDPELATDAGFALSVLATAGLLLLAPPMRDGLRRRGVPRGIAEALSVPTAAQLACAPVVAGISGTVSLVAVPANLLVVPVIVPATLTGVVAALLSPVWPQGAEFAAWLGSWPARWLVTVARVGSELPAAVLPWPEGAPGALLLAGLTVLAMLGLRRPVLRRLALVVALAATLGALPVRLIAGGWPPPGWLVVSCDVGQGDATVLNAGGGAAVVVDTGPLPHPVDECLDRLGVDTVPLLLISHFHLDHIGGLDGVLAGRPVGAVVTTAWPEPAAGHDAVVRAAAAYGVPVSAAPADGGWTVGAVRLTVLPGPMLRGTRSDPNNNSLLLLAEVRGVHLLLAGDAETERQQALLDAGVDLGAQVLKVAHHGSSYQSPDFLDAVAPRVALVSVGAGNDYGHPSLPVLARLAGHGARVLRTDLSGDVAVVLDDGGLSVATG
ncbi:ComEC/Rec2 family competence protein [Catellatospora tritici]|uniref:ComEC/Rec2 family competence protein n=1 Tax=Catellatospora tritici TaxID=2851566 RepID=UPI001C2DD4C9|nr:ComEC/Rec2 family competence protein [Catellatospora tritici]MBV1855673.1 ComEC/Rec2 family competence protein [Catellatospora tritici]